MKCDAEMLGGCVRVQGAGSLVAWVRWRRRGRGRGWRGQHQLEQQRHVRLEVVELRGHVHGVHALIGGTNGERAAHLRRLRERLGRVPTATGVDGKDDALPRRRVRSCSLRLDGACGVGALVEDDNGHLKEGGDGLEHDLWTRTHIV